MNNTTSYREQFVVILLAQFTFIHTLIHWRRKAWKLNPINYLNYKKGSLGNELGLFYAKNDFTPVGRAERHDVFHVLFEFDTSVKAECELQFFLAGNGKWSVFTFGTCVIAFILFPSWLRDFKLSYQIGKQYVNVNQLDFYKELNTDLIYLKKRLKNK
jgi:hypothetical protein